jgi:hypothetical protein
MENLLKHYLKEYLEALANDFKKRTGSTMYRLLKPERDRVGLVAGRNKTASI